jgi:hypothetical protein
MNHGWSKGLFAWFLAHTAWSRQFAQVFDFKRLQLDLLPGSGSDPNTLKVCTFGVLLWSYSDYCVNSINSGANIPSRVKVHVFFIA